MTYTPTDDPRYLGEEEDLQPIEDALVELQQEASVLIRAYSLFGHEAWPDIEATIREERKRVAATLETGEWEAILKARGNLAGLDFLLGLPERVQNELERKNDQIAELQNPAE